MVRYPEHLGSRLHFFLGYFAILRDRVGLGSTTTRTVCSGSQVIEEYEGTTLARRFVLGPGLDQPILMNKVAGTETARYYYLRNRQGSVIALTDAGGAVVESYGYVLLAIRVTS